MALQTYKAFADRMIGKYEGGYGWHPADPGGPTKYGITCYDLAEHTGQKMTSMATWAPIVKAMTLATAEVIYANKYANAVRYNDLPAGIDVVMMDYGVNSGVGRPIRVARALLSVPGGAKMDQKLLDAIKKSDPTKFVNDMLAERLHFMHAIRNGAAWNTFGGGWGARVADLKAYAHHLIAAPGTVAEPVPPDLTKVTMPKAIHGDPKVVSKTVKTTVGTATASGTGSHFSGLPLEVTSIIVGFMIVGGIAYVLYAKQKAANDNATVILPPAATPLVRPPSPPTAPILKAA
jgi:lysozyme family protein